jgi:hypothetical protein
MRKSGFSFTGLVLRLECRLSVEREAERVRLLPLKGLGVLFISSDAGDGVALDSGGWIKLPIKVIYR